MTLFWPTIILGSFVAFAIGIVVIARLRLLHERALYSRGKQHLVDREFASAIACFLRAERAWCLRLTNQSREQRAEDFARLKVLLMGIDVASQEFAARCDAGHCCRIIDEVVELLQNRSSFGRDSRMMHKHAAIQFANLTEELRSARTAFRKQAQDALKGQSERYLP